MSNLDRFDSARIATLILVLILSTSIVKFPGQIRDFLMPVLPLIRLWPDPDEQYRRSLSPVPYDLLRVADITLPRDATVLLVTSGDDVKYDEYLTYHRALFFLTPRPVWWLSAAQVDGTWESREWKSAALTPQSVQTVAGEYGAKFLITYALSMPLQLGQEIFSNRDGQLIQLDLSSPLLEPQVPRSFTAGRLWPLQAMAAVVTVLGIGSLILGGIARSGFNPWGIERLSLAWLLGCGFLSVGMFWLSVLGIKLKVQLSLLTLTGLLGLYLSGKQRPICVTAGEEMSWRRSLLHSPLMLFLLAILACQMAFVALLAIGRPLSAWDSWATWGLKARTIFLESSVSPAIYADPSRASTLPQYPLMFPSVEAWLFGWLGAPDDRLAGIVSLLFYAALGGIVYSVVLRRSTRSGLALLACAAVLPLPYLALLAGVVFADVLFALVATVLMVYALEWLDGRSPGFLVISALAAGLAVWTKEEGVILLGAAMVAVYSFECVKDRRLNPPRRVLLWMVACLVSTLTLAGPWWYFVQQKGHVERIFLAVTPQTFLQNLDRVPEITGIAIKILASSNFGFLWPFALIFGLYIVRKSGLKIAFQDRKNLLLLCGLFYLVLIACSYVFSDYVPLRNHLVSSYYRLVVQVSPLAIIWLALPER